MLTGAKVINLCEEVDECESPAALLMKELLSFSLSYILDVIYIYIHYIYNIFII